jgi:hypothetical protein
MGSVMCYFLGGDMSCIFWAETVFAIEGGGGGGEIKI